MLWRTTRKGLELYWWAVGGQRRTVFQETLNLDPKTRFPDHRTLRLPPGHWRRRIVNYGDHVQLRALAKLLEELPGKPTVVEVGASTGAYAVILGRLLQKKGGKLFAIEPNRRSYELLVQNVERNRLGATVHCERIGIMDEPGFALVVEHGQQSRLAVSPKGGAHEIAVDTLRGFLARQEVSSVDILIADVEGAELPVLRGYPWESVRLGRVFCELHPYAWAEYGYGGAEFVAFLREHHLRCIDTFLYEHKEFPGKQYIGPTVLMPE